MENLEELWLGFSYYYTALDRPRESLNFCSFTNLCRLRKLDLSWRQMEDEDFPSYLHELSSLEELHLSGNSKLVQLPPSISLLSHLKHLELNDCRQLQNFHALPSEIQVLRASNCPELEKIGDLTEEYVWLYKIWLPGCKKLLENQEDRRCLDKMLQQSFLKKCAAVDRRLSIAIPGSKIPSWFKEQHGNQIELKLHQEFRTKIMGFAVCGVFQHKWLLDFVPTSIHFSIGKSRISFPKSMVDEAKVDYIDASEVAENGNVWIAYIPFSSFQQQMVDDFEGKDWSLFDKDYLTISIIIRGAQKVERCGVHVVYEEDVESTQQIKTCIPDYRNSDNVLRYDNTFVYRETLRTIDR
ncbi:uncharacterized protein LOC112500089 [Cynara cardunculus var. scolymus]|uniref:uncharacterized protein LOC112500089 n=1 Tax=Cynara cardunculus var. scolymus TaxID=59895 RepID=UPI000D62CEE9|nr:uncharacterized protein LOC112500089 [Cynara cardunculus var. scolymus]